MPRLCSGEIAGIAQQLCAPRGHEHDQARFELRESSSAFDAGISSMRQTLTAIQNANHAQGRAIDRVMAANKLAMRLFNDPDSPQ